MPPPAGIRFRYRRATSTPLSNVSEHSHSSLSQFANERETSVTRAGASPQLARTNRRSKDKDKPDLKKLELFQPALPADHEHHLPETDGSLLEEEDNNNNNNNNNNNSKDDPLVPKQHEIQQRKAHLEARRAEKEAKMAKREAAFAAAAAAERASRLQSSRPLQKDTLPAVRKRVRNKKLQTAITGAHTMRDRRANGNADVALMAARRAPGNRAGRLMRNGMVGVMNAMENGAEMEPTEEERETEENVRQAQREQSSEGGFFSRVLREAK